MTLRGELAVLLVCGLLALLACGEEPPPAPSEEIVAPPAPEPERRVVGHLDVPVADIRRAREEAAGLDRLNAVLRAQTLLRRREEGPSYAELQVDTDRFANRTASFEGQVGLAQPAGQDLWIIALSTRRASSPDETEGERWVDPLYVLSPLPPPFPEGGGVQARIDGWVVGRRTIGRHELPLILAYHLEAL